MNHKLNLCGRVIGFWLTALSLTSCVWPVPGPGEPVPTITTSTDWSAVAQTATISVTFSHISPNSVWLYASGPNGDLLKQDVTEPFSFTLDVSQYTPGDHEIVVMATDDTTVVVEEEILSIPGYNDLLTPAYYASVEGAPIREEVDVFLSSARKILLHHPAKKPNGDISEYSTPHNGLFGAEKGNQFSHHAAIDLHFADGETIDLYAAHDGEIFISKNSNKYRHFLAIKKPVTDDDGNLLGYIVTYYAHVDLDLNEAEGYLPTQGSGVTQGELISKYLYSGTAGGPHLHFEIRYYRAEDNGDEEFYGGESSFLGRTDPSHSPWSFGYWDPESGYGFANPESHDVTNE